MASSVPPGSPGSSPLCLPLGEVVFYSTGRPSIRTLVSQIAAFGFILSHMPTSVHFWHWAYVVGDFILFILLPPVLSESSLDQSDNGSSSYNGPYYDLDNVNPDAPWLGYGYWQT